MDSPAFFSHYWSIPYTLTIVKGKKKPQTELGFARSGNKQIVNLKSNADLYSLMMEVFIAWWLLTCYLYHIYTPASRAHARCGTWDTTSTELRMHSLHTMLGAVLGRCSHMLSASWAQISIVCFSGLLRRHKLAWWYLWLVSATIYCMVYTCLIKSY